MFHKPTSRLPFFSFPRASTRATYVSCTKTRKNRRSLWFDHIIRFVRLLPASSGTRNSRLQNEHILRTKIFVPELAGLPGMGRFCGYDKVWSFIIIPSIEQPLPVLGRGRGYDKDRPKATVVSTLSREQTI